MTAQPTEDHTDPLVILHDLPERERKEFLRQYHRAVDAAHDPAGYQHLRRLLHAWSLTVIAAGQAGYYEELAAARGNGHDCAGHRCDSGLGRTSRRGPGPAVTYRAELSGRALKQMHGLPGPAFDRLIEAMAEVIDYPDDTLRTLPTSDPYIRRVEFGGTGLITYLINDGTSTVIILDITWAGLAVATDGRSHSLSPGPRAQQSVSRNKPQRRYPWVRQESLPAAAR